MHYPHLFSPVQINTMALKNRIVMTAMHLGYTPGGKVTDRLVEFYALRARGGAALIIVGGCTIDPWAGMADMISIKDDSFLPGLVKADKCCKSRGRKDCSPALPGRTLCSLFHDRREKAFFRLSRAVQVHWGNTAGPRSR